MKQYLPSQPPDAAAAEPNAADGGILQFSSMVNVNDDQRRSIQTDLEEIEASDNKLKDELESDMKIGAELSKSEAHSVKEVCTYEQRTTENLEALNMNQEIIRRLEKTFQSEITTRANPRDDWTPATTNDEAENMPPIVSPTFSVEALHKGDHAMSVQLKTSTDSFKADMENLRDLVAQEKKLREATDEIRASWKSDMVQERLTQLDEKIRDGAKDYEAECNRCIALKANLEAVSKRAKMDEKYILALEKECNKKQKLVRSSRSNAEQQASDAAAAEAIATATLAKCKAKREAMAESNVSFEKQVLQAFGLIKSREEKKSQREATRAERLNWRTDEKSLQEDIVSATASSEASKRLIYKNDKHSVNLEAIQAENNKIECERVLQGRSEYDDLCKQKQKLTEWIAADLNSTVILEHSESLQAEIKEHNKLEEEAESVVRELEEAQSKLLELERIIDDQKDGMGKELASLAAAVKNAEEECAMEAGRIEEAEKAASKLTVAADLYNKLKLYRSGAKLLKQASVIEDNIRDASTDHYGLDDMGTYE